MDTKIAKMAEKKQWKKLEKITDGKKIDDIINVAEACGLCKDEEAYNILVSLLSNNDVSVKVAAVTGLGSLRYDIGSQITRLQWFSDRHAGNAAIAAAVSGSVAKLRAILRG